MKFIIYLLYLIICALILALLEIQIEGKYGWAKKLPTFKLKQKIGIKPITGYHIYFLSFTILLIHLPLFFTGWSLKNELLIIGSWIFIWSLEDFLWFIFNPYFGLKKFNKQNKNLWWHQSWFLGLPTFYWLVFPLAAILISLSC